MGSAESRRRLLAWLALVAWMGLIFFFSHQPGDELVHFGGLDLLVKKGGHFTVYAILGILAASATRSWPLALILVVLYALSDELHQRFVPGRNGNALDVGIDTAGGVFAWAMHALWKRRAARNGPLRAEDGL